MGIFEITEPTEIQLTLSKTDVVCNCLLYTSDAADERSSVDLGGRRIIKKKKRRKKNLKHSEISKSKQTSVTKYYQNQIRM